MAGGAERGNDSDKPFKCFVEGHIIKGDERSGDLRKAFDGSRKTALQTWPPLQEAIAVL